MLRRLLLPLLALAFLAGCTSRPPAPSPPAPSPDWPRIVTDADGNEIEIAEPPQRIHTLSVGYDEITMALVGPERFAAVGTSTANPLYSNIAELAEQVPLHVGRKSEDVIAAQPDLVVASPYANKELVAQLKEVGLTVVVSDLNDSIEGHASNIRFLGHLYGAEAEAEALVAKVEERLAAVEAIVSQQGKRPGVIYLSEKLNTPGLDTTLGGIIHHAGGRNLATEAGLQNWQQITLEKVVELAPDVILVPADDEEFGNSLLNHPSLQGLAFQVFRLPQTYTSTLSHWNVLGVEALAKLLWPEAFADVTFAEW